MGMVSKQLMIHFSKNVINQSWKSALQSRLDCFKILCGKTAKNVFFPINFGSICIFRFTVIQSQRRAQNGPACAWKHTIMFTYLGMFATLVLHLLCKYWSVYLSSLQCTWEQNHTNNSISCLSSSLTTGVSSSVVGWSFSLCFIIAGFCCTSCLTVGVVAGAVGLGSSLGDGLVSCCSRDRTSDSAPTFFWAADCRALSRCNCCRLRLPEAGFRPRTGGADTVESEKYTWPWLLQKKRSRNKISEWSAECSDSH